jgi:hypothetical protein
MSDKVDGLVLENLRSIRGTLSDHGERLGRVALSLSAMEQALGSLCALSGSDRETLSSLARRIKRIEQRLDLASSDA